MPEVAVVTGASRGVGRGVAGSLHNSGYEVYAAARTIDQAKLPESVHRVPNDLTKDNEIDELFRHVEGGLDILVNSAWGGYERMDEDGAFTWARPFWEQPMHRWDSMMDAGVRAAFNCSAHAARIMIPRRRGLVVNISFWAARKHVGNVLYGVSKAATDKMTADMAHELRPHGISVISLYPGLVRTESVMKAAEAGWLDLSNSESPEFIGLVIAAFAKDPAILDRSGQVLIAAEAAVEYGIRDIDGRQPKPLTIDSV